jgi:anti-anti-sigma factor
MKTDISDDGRLVVVSVEGRLDAASSASFEEAVEALPALEPPRRILIDLTPLEFISSAGLRSFLILGKACRTSGASLAFSSLNAMVADVFKISGFDSMFKIFANRQKALSALEEGDS